VEIDNHAVERKGNGVHGVIVIKLVGVYTLKKVCFAYLFCLNSLHIGVYRVYKYAILPLLDINGY